MIISGIKDQALIEQDDRNINNILASHENLSILFVLGRSVHYTLEHTILSTILEVSLGIV